MPSRPSETPNHPAELGRRSLLYLAGNAVSGAVLFLLIPLHTAYLVPSEYGRFDLDLSYVYLAITVVFLDINQVILRFMYLENRNGCAVRPVYSALPLLAIGAPVYAAGILVLARFASFPYPWLLVVLGLLTKSVDVYGATCRGLGRTADFVKGEIAYALIVVVTTVALMVGVGVGLRTLYVAAIAGYVCQLAYLEARVGLARRARASLVSRALGLSMVRYAAPLVLNVLAYWVLNRYARIVISRELSVGENGLYAVAAGVALALAVLARNFMRAWQETAFAVPRAGSDRGSFFSGAFAALVTILCAVYVVMLPAVVALFPCVFAREYHDAAHYVAPALLAVMLQALDLFLSHIHGHILDNRIVVLSTVSGAIVCVVLSGTLVRALGVNGASLAICLGFMLAIAVKTSFLRRRVGLQVRAITTTLSIVGVGLATAAVLTGWLAGSIAGVVALLPAAALIRRRRGSR